MAFAPSGATRVDVMHPRRFWDVWEEAVVCAAQLRAFECGHGAAHCREGGDHKAGRVVQPRLHFRRERKRRMQRCFFVALLNKF